MSSDEETTLDDERGRWENEGGGIELTESPTPEETDPTPVAERFPAVTAGKLRLKELELDRLVDEGTLGRYRVQQKGLGEAGPVFLVTLFGATCSKVELSRWRELSWHDYLAAMRRAIEREIGYWQNGGTPLPTGRQRIVEVTVRDEDFTIPRSER